ncbi:hypothetical protein BJX66DRAFT_298940 [Aspergillus keveii]|uniref:Uncharacterized protein n=1 Tax=Aspergillus keveii TaxID=714993 RepID=A0ABR4GD12_9EURO
MRWNTSYGKYCSSPKLTVLLYDSQSKGGHSLPSRPRNETRLKPRLKQPPSKQRKRPLLRRQTLPLMLQTQRTTQKCKAICQKAIRMIR